jgi:hypothetical protein
MHLAQKSSREIKEGLPMKEGESQNVKTSKSSEKAPLVGL